jgi:two-component system, cell cycle sensor histidine kinase and response regulator CckA
MPTVLVVDDDTGVRDLVAMVLKMNGYSVITAANGLEGLMVYSSYRNGLDLILTDIDMQQMDGIELARRIRAGDASKRILLMSGRPPDDRNPPENCQFLAKPFLPKQLLEAVQDVLSKSEV